MPARKPIPQATLTGSAEQNARDDECQWWKNLYEVTQKEWLKLTKYASVTGKFEASYSIGPEGELENVELAPGTKQDFKVLFNGLTEKLQNDLRTEPALARRPEWGSETIHSSFANHLKSSDKPHLPLYCKEWATRGGFAGQFNFY